MARLADALRRLADRPATHPATVRVIDAGLEGTSAFVAMEYASGESLDVALRHLAPASIDRALSLLTGVASAIDAAWAASAKVAPAQAAANLDEADRRSRAPTSRDEADRRRRGDGLGHGALHPRDILITHDTFDLRITGFGIVSAIESIGEKPPVRRPYAAPERAAGHSWDVRADVYSLGVIAHEILAGRRPAGGGEQDGVLAPGLAPEARVSIRRVLAAALAERPDDRFVSASAFVEALAVAARGDVPALPDEAVSVTAMTEAVAGLGRLTLESEHPALESEFPESEAEHPTAAPDHAAAAPLPAPASGSSEFDSEPLALGSSRSAQAPGHAASGATHGALDRPLGLGSRPSALGSATEHPAPGTEHAAPSTQSSAPSTQHSAPSTEHPALSTEHPALSTQHAAPSTPRSTPSTQRPARLHPYPWLALAVVALAGIVLGAVAGYQLGLRRGSSVARAVAPVATGARADTDVPVLPDAPPRAAGSTGAPERTGTDPAPPPAAPAPESPARVVATHGRLVVRSIPAGALVFVDGRRLGETPTTLRDLPLGLHTVQVARPGYVPRSEEVRLTTAVPVRTLVVELKPGLETQDAATGSVFLDSRPRGARAIVDGRFVGLTPLSVPEMSAGEHLVRFELDGLAPVTSKVTVKAGALARVTVALK